MSECKILPKPDPLACYQCGRPYGADGWIEALVPNDVWARITPSVHPEGGILCILCISDRCVELGLENVPVKLCGTEPLKAAAGNAALREEVAELTTERDAALEWAERYEQVVAERDRLREALTDVLAFEAERTGSDCGCIFRSKKMEQAYETGQCPHQRARAALSKGER